MYHHDDKLFIAMQWPTRSKRFLLASWCWMINATTQIGIKISIFFSRVWEDLMWMDSVTHIARYTSILFHPWFLIDYTTFLNFILEIMHQLVHIWERYWSNMCIRNVAKGNPTGRIHSCSSCGAFLSSSSQSKCVIADFDAFSNPKPDENTGGGKKTQIF